MSCILDLNSASKQVKDKRQINVLSVNKTGKLSNLGRLEISVKLITLKPSIVEFVSDCACYLKIGICPSVSPDHSEIEIIKTIKSVAGFFPTLWSKRIIRKLKACVERVHVNVHSRVRKIGLVVNILLKDAKLLTLLIFFYCFSRLAAKEFLDFFLMLL